MPTFSIPQKLHWNVDYSADSAGEIYRTFNTDLFRYPGKIVANSPLIPHTTNDDVGTIRLPTQFVVSDFEGQSTPDYWFAATRLFKSTDAQTTAFAADTLTSTPTTLVDSDMLAYGRTSTGFDIEIVSGVDNGVDLARFNRDEDTSTWNPIWWTGGTQSTISTTFDSGEVQVLTTAAHGLSTSDIVIIRGHPIPGVNGVWTITVLDATQFLLDGSVFDSSSGGGTINLIDNGGMTYLGQNELDSGFPTILKRFLSVYQDLLCVANANFLHTVDLLGNVQYRRLVLLPTYRINWIVPTKERLYIGAYNRDSTLFPSIVVEYDPYTESASSIPVDEGATMGFIHDNVCHIIDIRGNVARFNGSGFDAYSAFPTRFLRPGITMNLPHRNGISESDADIFFNILGSPFNYGNFSGLWRYEVLTGRLYHYAGYSFNQTSGNDPGAVLLNSSGALLGNFGPGANLIAGASVKDDSGSQIGAYVTDGYIPASFPSAIQECFIITGRFKSVKDAVNTYFGQVFLAYANRLWDLGPASGTITIKYRFQDSAALGLQGQFSGTWVSDTTLTVTNVLQLVEGDDIFITAGEGAGTSATVTDITGTTVTIDKTVSGASGDLNYSYENWTKLDEEATSNTVQYLETAMQENEAQWVQFKVIIQGTFAIERLAFGYQPNRLIEK